MEEFLNSISDFISQFAAEGSASRYAALIVGIAVFSFAVETARKAVSAVLSVIGILLVLYCLMPETFSYVLQSAAEIGKKLIGNF